MNTASLSRITRAVAAALPLLAAATGAQADAVTDWNVRANDIVIESKVGTPQAIRVMAYVQTAVHAAVQRAASGASLDAAVAAANRAALSKLLPAQQASIDKAYDAGDRTVILTDDASRQAQYIAIIIIASHLCLVCIPDHCSPNTRKAVSRHGHTLATTTDENRPRILVTIPYDFCRRKLCKLRKIIMRIKLLITHILDVIAMLH